MQQSLITSGTKYRADHFSNQIESGTDEFILTSDVFGDLLHKFVCT